MVVKLGGRGPGHKSRTPPGTTTAAMTLAGLSTLENSAAGTLIGTLSTVGTTGTPTFALDNNAGARAALSGANINRGATALSYATASFFDITVSVTGVTPTISPTTFRIAITPTTIVPALFGKPDATNTGVQSGITLVDHTGAWTILDGDLVIENQRFVGDTLNVQGDNIIIRNCRFEGFGSWGVDAELSLNIVIEHCDFIGAGDVGNTNAAILGAGTFRYNHIRNCEDGMKLTSGTNIIVTDNYIHNLIDAGPDPHHDGIAVQGGQNGVLIENNTIAGHDTSCVFIKSDDGAINNVTVRGNLLYNDPNIGLTAFTVFVDDFSAGARPITNIVVEANYVEQGAFGYYSTTNTSPTIRNNIEWQQGVGPIPYP